MVRATTGLGFDLARCWLWGCGRDGSRQKQFFFGPSRSPKKRPHVNFKIETPLHRIIKGYRQRKQCLGLQYNEKLDACSDGSSGRAVDFLSPPERVQKTPSIYSIPSTEQMGTSSAPRKLSHFFFNFVVLLLIVGGSDLIQCSVTYDRKSLIIDGQRRILISGSIHYPRSTPDVIYYFPCYNSAPCLITMLIW